MNEPTAITPLEDLRSVYRDPSPFVVDKAVPVVDPASARFIAASPFLVLATTGTSGTDASPRGGAPGFVRVIDDGRRLAFADLSGNNRLDSYGNVLDDPRVGLLFFVPGSDETVRVNGRATITTDERILDLTTTDDRRPKVAVVVDVDECFIHCAKALRRGGLWDPTTWPDDDVDVPTAGQIINDQHALGLDPQVITDDLEAGYRMTLWEPGGE